MSSNPYPSVSAILQATRAPQERQRLAAWKKRVGQAEAKKIIEHGRQRGILLHRMVEAHFCKEDDISYLSQVPAGLVVEILPQWQKLKSIFSSLDNLQFLESPVVHRPGHYQGVVDMVCDFKGQPVILDWKTSFRPKKAEYLTENALQLAAYCGAVNRMHGTKICNGVIVVSSPEALQVFEFKLGSYWLQWLERLHTFWLTSRHQLQRQAQSSLASHYPQLMATTRGKPTKPSSRAAFFDFRLKLSRFGLPKPFPQTSDFDSL